MVGKEPTTLASQESKIKHAAEQVAAEAGGKALAWRMQDDGVIVVVLVDGRKISKKLSNKGSKALHQPGGRKPRLVKSRKVDHEAA